MFLTSFKPLQETLLWPPTYFPHHITEKAFTTVLSRSPVPTYLLNSVIYSLLTTVIVTVAGLFTAYALVRYPFRGSRLALTGFLVVRLIPPISLLLPFYLILRYLGLINTRTGVIIYTIYLCYPLVVWMLKSFFDSFPKELIDAALVDGASRIGALLRIVVPSLAPGISAVAIIAFLWTWNEFLAPFLFLNSDFLKPITVGIYYFVGDEMTYWNTLAAAAVLAVIPGIIFFVIAQRWIVKGLTAGVGKA
jgi:ABC-type glycerol-3-phosphate transport system permease component